MALRPLINGAPGGKMRASVVLICSSASKLRRAKTWELKRSLVSAMRLLISLRGGVAQPGLSGAVFSGVRMKIAFESRGGDRAYWLA
jgi:hypothetical protein